MEILGIGPLELLFIFLIALIVLGPTDMVKAGRTLGRLMRRIVMSPGWQTFQRASRDLRYLPNKLMRDAGLEDLEKDLETFKNISRETNKDLEAWKKDITSWTTPPIVNTPEEPPVPIHETQSPPENLEETEQG
jgi:Sec-independent protein translocase protein TatA